MRLIRILQGSGGAAGVTALVVTLLAAAPKQVPLLHGQAPAAAPPPAPPPVATNRTYVGSAACQPCHRAIYDRWSRTRMANVVRDPREHPEAVLPDFKKPDPVLTFLSRSSLSSTGQNGSNATSPKSETTTFHFPRSGTSHIGCGDPITFSQTPTGGFRFTRPVTCSGQLARCVMAAIP